MYFSYCYFGSSTSPRNSLVDLDGRYWTPWIVGYIDTFFCIANLMLYKNVNGHKCLLTSVILFFPHLFWRPQIETKLWWKVFGNSDSEYGHEHLSLISGKMCWANISSPIVKYMLVQYPPDCGPTWLHSANNGSTNRINISYKKY